MPSLATAALGIAAGARMLARARRRGDGPAGADARGRRARPARDARRSPTACRARPAATPPLRRGLTPSMHSRPHRPRLESRRPPRHDPRRAAAAAPRSARRSGLVVLRDAAGRRGRGPGVPQRRGARDDRARAAGVRDVHPRRRDRDRPPAAARCSARARSTSTSSTSTIWSPTSAASRSRTATSPTRPFNLVPLAEIAPERVDPRAEADDSRDRSRAPTSRASRAKARAMHFFANRQDEAPDVRLSLNRVGVSSVKHIIRLNVGGDGARVQRRLHDGRRPAPDKAGVHMSRFSELLEAATLDVLARRRRAGAASKISSTQIAREIVVSQDAMRADVRVRAEFGLERWTPVSGKRTEETYTLVGIAHADARGTRRARRRRSRRDDGLPVRAADGARALAARTRRRRLQRTPTRTARSTRCRSRRTTSAAAARC